MFVVMMSPCIGCSIEGNYSITSIRERELGCVDFRSLAMVNDPAFLCNIDVPNCQKSSYCNHSNSNEDSAESTCLCYYNITTIEHLHEFKFLELTWLVFLGVGLLLIVLPIILFFNINLVSGSSRSFVFFYQCLPLASPAGKVLSLIVMQNQIYTFLSFTLLPSFVGPGSRNLPLVSPYYFLEYFKYILSIIAIVLVLFLVKCNCCPFQKCRLPWARMRRATRHFREKHTARRTILHGIGSVIVLAYGDLVSISFNILSGGPMPSCCVALTDGCPQPCPNLPFIQTSMPAFFSIACVVVILLLLLPMALIYSPSIPTLFHKLPLPRFSKLHPVFDVFQGVYKDKLRWYAGLHLLYLVVMWSLYAGLATKKLIRSAVLSFSFIIILGVHSLIQPYKEPKHNYYESLYLLYLILASVGTMVFKFFIQLLVSANLSLENDYITFYIIAILSYVMGSLPIVTVICVCCYKCCKKRTCCRPSKCCQLLHPTKPESRAENENDDGGDPLPERLPCHVAAEMM